MRLRNIPEAKEIVKNSKYVLSYPLDAAASLFVQNKPMSLEIGMGKGKFIIEMAKLHPEKFFIGVERYESVLLRAVQKMEKLEEAGEAPENLRFICEDASVLPEIFGPDCVEDIYLNFSDPWPKSRHADRRLTSPRFLRVYEKFLKNGGRIIFKTDNRGLFDYSVEVAEEDEGYDVESVSYDLHRELAPGEENIMTEYEVKFSNLGSKICRMDLSKKM